jgi:protein TonB
MRNLVVFTLAGALLAGAAGASEDSEAMGPARAKANLASLFSDQDYPAEAVAAREQGAVGFSLDVGPTGLVSACAITRSSGSALLDSTTCRIMAARARFTPARDRNGHPVPDRLAGRIVWRLPPPPPPPAS